MATIDKRKAVEAALEYTRQRRFDKAIAEYQSALKADPQDVTLCKKLGDLYAQTGAVQEAIATYMKLGDLFRADGLAVKAIAIYKMVLNLDPRNMQIYLACADLYAEQGLMGEAKIQYMTVAEHYTRAGESLKALPVFEKIAKLDPTNFAAAAKVAEMCEKEKLGDQAVANYVAAGQAAARAGHSKEAREFYGRALRLAPNAVEPLFGLAKLHVDAGDYKMAVAPLERAAAAGNPAPLLLLGECYRKLGSPAQAEEALRRAVEADPTATEARLELARCLLEGGQADAAHAAFADAADQLLEEGREQDAVALLQGLCAEDPQAAKVLAKLAEIHQRLGREEEAREVQCRLAAAYESRGDRPAATTIYRSILEVVPDHPHCLARLEALDEVGGAAGMAVAEPPGGGEGASLAGAMLPEEEAEPRVISIAQSVEVPGEDVAALGEGEPGTSLYGVAAGAAAAVADVSDDAAEVAEQLAEAEVYLKYGLVEKAIERLRETLAEAPQNLAARARLRALFLAERRVPEGVAEGLALVDALAAREQVDRAVQELVALVRVDPENRAIQERLQQLCEAAPAVSPEGRSAPPPAPPAAPWALPQEVEAALPAVPPVVEVAEAPAPAEGTPWGTPRLVPPEAPTGGPDIPATPEILPPGGELEPLLLLAESSPEESPAVAGLAGEGEQEAEEVLDLSGLFHLSEPEGAEAPAVLEAAEPLPLGFGEPSGQEPEALMRPEAAEPAPQPAAAIPLSLGGIAEELEEAEFYRTQGMLREAAATYRRVLDLEPGNAAAQAGLAALDARPPAAEGLPEVAPATDLIEVAPRDEVVAGERWVPGPEPFPLETSLDLDLPPPPVPAEPELAGPGLDLTDLQLLQAEPYVAPSSAERNVVPEPAGPSAGESLSWDSRALAPQPPSAAPRDTIPETEVSLSELTEEATLAEAPVAGPAPAAAPPGPTEVGATPPWAEPLAPAPPPAPAPAPAAPRRLEAAEDLPRIRVTPPADALGLGGFVDLGAEIQKEMNAPGEGAMLMDSLLGEFQRGVRENLDAEDYETHYNLGIAYKGMDLLEEAIEEFRLAAKDPARRLNCSGLIALCFLSKGEAEQAIEELNDALALPDHAPEEYHALRYDLATAYEAAGQEARALEVLEVLVAQAPSLRDATGRVAALRARLRQPGRGTKAPAPPSRPVPAAAEVAGVAGTPRQAPSVAPRAGAPPRPAPSEDGKASQAQPAAPASKPARPRRDKISFV